ncbi:Oxygen-independent coproporphyrinogen-III oxidase-like protein YqeR [bacterium HR08]|nr:Oxygen-independent coproporphyrinogen-III oxidase-like protein YqeR [bacterium HR08]
MVPWGIYVHVPFCPYKCAYCDFDSGVHPQETVAAYVAALREEIARAGVETLSVDTIYFGGGTPSLLDPDVLGELLHTVRRTFAVRPEVEITLEANPGTITAEKARAFRALGVNRVSLGAQTFEEGELRRLGRRHTVEQIGESAALLRAAGMENLNLDLIIGIPGQTLTSWERTMDRAFSLRPTHLSVYLLEVHDGTPLAAQLAHGRMVEPDETLTVTMYYRFLERAEEEGYEQYEISNFCRPGFASRHNLKYWSDEPYLGFGCSAHSYDFRERRRNLATPQAYIAAMRERGEAVAGRIAMTERRRIEEALMLGLRRRSGVNLSAFRERYGVEVLDLYGDRLAPLGEAGLIEISGGWLRLTRRGLIVANEVFAVFV